MYCMQCFLSFCRKFSVPVSGLRSEFCNNMSGAFLLFCRTFQFHLCIFDHFADARFNFSFHVFSYLKFVHSKQM